MSRAAGFTLIEVTISLGIVAFAMVSLVGLLPAGLSNFRVAMSNTIEAQIVQALSEDVAATDFVNLASLANQKYTFDSRGMETAADGRFAMYTASIVLQPIDDPASFPVRLKDASARNEAYSVQIQISQVGKPTQISKYSLIVANEKGHAAP